MKLVTYTYQLAYSFREQDAKDEQDAISILQSLYPNASIDADYIDVAQNTEMKKVYDNRHEVVAFIFRHWKWNQ